jgi:formylglycine-generating enzyme required for sulfatase activity
MQRQSILVLAMVIVLMCGMNVQAVTMDMVTVGNPGNADDATGYGGVAYHYQIGKYEVTAGQYTEFLNAVAATDTYGLYNTAMADISSIWNGCNIQRMTYGVIGGNDVYHTYSVAADWANRPVNYVSWNDALRFSNWLHNGQPTGAQDATTTEDGAYDMSLGSSVVRKAGATVWLPSEDEWYKAAYHKNDGVTGNYFDYPTSNDDVPSNDLVEPTDPGNNATFNDYGNYTIGSPYYRTEVGAHENSDSPYGTFDMGGNVFEWNEALFTDSYSRGLRGGSYTMVNVAFLTSDSCMYFSPEYEDSWVGFRVASVPEQAFEVEAEITPHTLNVQSKGKWISCKIWLPEDYDVADVNSYSVTLEDEIEAEWIWFDQDQQVIMAKFSRSALQEILADLEIPTDVELLVSGRLNDGTFFEGTDTIRLIEKTTRSRRRLSGKLAPLRKF